MVKKVLCLSSLLLLSACSLGGGIPTLPVGAPIPETRIYNMDGNASELSAALGDTTVLVFWASWCSKSKQEMQKLESFAAAHPQVRVLAVSVDKQEDEAKLKEKIKDLGLIHMQHAFSGNEAYDETYLAFHVDEIPHFFVINKQGMIIAEGTRVATVEKALPKIAIR